MRLMYIYHSGYVIETDDFAVLIDYFKDTGEASDGGYVHDVLLKSAKPLYVLSSHFHPDHFNWRVLEWKKQKKNIHYVLSRDILLNRKAKEDDAIFLDKGDEYKDENLTIRAFGSTDAGISFLIDMGGKHIFHAGDLNNWHWKDESTPESSAEAEQFYLNELEDVAQAVGELDVAMFPVDPRLGSDFARGAEQFIDRIPTKLFAPMHFAEWYDKLLPFRKYAEERGVHFANWTKKGQSIEF